MELVVFETSNKNVSIGHSHFSVLTHVVLPLASVHRATVVPFHAATAFTLASFPVAFVARFFRRLRSKRAGDGELILHDPLSAGSAVLEVSSVVVSVFKSYQAETIK